MVLWPFRMAWLLFIRPRRARVRKAIFLGFEGFDPAVAEALMAKDEPPSSRVYATGAPTGVWACT